MNNKDFTTTLVVKRTPEEVYNTILNPRKWWSGLFDESFQGTSENVGDVFSFRAGGGVHHRNQKLVELIAQRRIAWLVTDANLSFVNKTDEWNGTTICFDISREEDKTKVVFTHVGLVPAFECYDSCAPAWNQYIHEKLAAALR